MSKEAAEHPGSDPTPEDALINAAFEQVAAGGGASPGGGLNAGLDPWGPDKPLADSIPGYEILREIHRGGQGVVYQAIQKSTKRRVAIKVMREGPFAGKSDRARFEREVEVLGQLNHPNIVNVHDSGEAAGCFYFVMDYISGHPLDAWLTSGDRTVEEVLRLFRKICEAVHAAHLKGVIHRDLKPGNIRIDDAGEPHVLDFGLAKLAYGVEEASQMTATGQFVGSLPWASPEQAEARPGKIDLRTDVYSLGVILYQMLTGRFPYDVIGNMRDVLDRIMRAEPARPSTVRVVPPRRNGVAADAPVGRGSGGRGSGGRGSRRAAGEPPTSRGRRVVSRAHRINDEVDTIVLKCLSKERERRYQSAGELARDIGRYLGGEPIEAKADSVLYLFRKQLRKYRTPVAVAVVLMVILVSGLATSLALWQKAVTAERLEAGERKRADMKAAEAQAAARSEAEQRRIAEDEKERAERALAAEADQRKLAERRATETKLVADFQAKMLSEIDVEAMGRGIKEGFREQVRAAIARQYVGEYPNRRSRTEEEIEAELAAYDERARSALPVDVARRVMDEYVLKRAGQALEEEFADQPLVQAQIKDAIGKTYQALALYDKAELYLRTALELRRGELGTEHESVAESLNNLARLLYDKRDYAAAEPLQREALAMRRKLLGDEHPQVADSLNNLAWLLYDNGDYATAESLFREALAMRRKLLGDEHPDVATSLNNLAALLDAKGDYSAAELLCHEALAIRRKLLGEDHPHVATSLNNLAELLHDKGDYSAAEPLYREALTMRRKLLGNDHPAVATSLNNLAELLYDKSDYAAAERLYREALTLYRKLQGDEHPNVATGLNNLAMLLQAKGDYAAAEPLYCEALAMRRKRLGDEHPDVATSLDCLAWLLYAKSDYAAAEPLLREALAMRRKLLGDEHQDVAYSMNNLAALLQAKGDYAEAEPLQREALALYREHLGDENPHVATSLNNLALLLQAKGDYAAAEPLQREAVVMYRKLLGDEHPASLKLANNLGGLLLAMGRPREVIDLLAPLEPAERRVFADGNAIRLGQFLTHLGRSRAAVGEFEPAEANLIESQAIVLRAKDAAASDCAKVLTGLIDLYEAWSEALGGAGDDHGRDARAAHAAEWRAKLAEWQATTQPADRASGTNAATQPTSSPADEDPGHPRISTSASMPGN